MKQTILIFLMATMALLSGCVDDTSLDTTNVTLNFKPTYNGEPLVMNQDFLYSNGKKTQFSQVYLYISDITLIDNDNVAVLLKDVDLINFTNMLTLEDAEKGVDLFIEKVPLGQFKAIRFGLGVNSELNKQNPQNTLADVLKKPDNYWDGWQSYIFAKFEGRMDINDLGLYTRGFTYHTGSDEVYRTKEITLPIDLTVNNRLNFTMDLAKTLNGINLAEDDGTHSVGDISIATTIMENIKADGIK